MIALHHEAAGVSGDDHAGARSAADRLSLAAAPTFAIMALITGVFGGGQPDLLCAQDASPMSGMALMYILMSTFHLAPWLKLIASLHAARPSRGSGPGNKAQQRRE